MLLRKTTQMKQFKEYLVLVLKYFGAKSQKQQTREEQDRTKLQTALQWNHHLRLAFTKPYTEWSTPKGMSICWATAKSSGTDEGSSPI